MPELPEVETIRRSLAPLVEGRRITALAVADPRWCAPLAPEELADAVVGRTIEALSRRGKWLVYELEGEVFLITHLRMTGAFLYDAQPDAPYERVRIGLGDGHELRFCDPRRFGTGELAFGVPALETFFASRVGVEPLGEALNGAVLHALTRGSRAPVKAFLLDQKRVAGVGNIYADEALWRAGINPAARTITRPQAARLHEAIVHVLAQGIDNGGTTLRDYVDADGDRGENQHALSCYGRHDEPCLRCGTALRRRVLDARGTTWCPVCQRR